MKKEQTLGLLVLGSVVVFLITLSAVLPGPRVGFQPSSSVTTLDSGNLDEMNDRRIKSQGQKRKKAKLGQRSRVSNDSDIIDPTVEKPKITSSSKQVVSTESSNFATANVQSSTKKTTNSKTPKQFQVATKQNASSQLSAKMRSQQLRARMRKGGRKYSGVIELFKIIEVLAENQRNEEVNKSLKVNASN